MIYKYILLQGQMSYNRRQHIIHEQDHVATVECTINIYFAWLKDTSIHLEKENKWV